MSVDRDPGQRSSWSGDAGAWRLHAAVTQACQVKTDLPARLEAGLRAALEMLAADPALARLLTLDPFLEEEEKGGLDALREWIGRFGELLRDAVAADPRTTTSDVPFLAGFVIGGVRFQIARLVLNGEADDLPRLLPGLLEGVLSYYFEPGEPRALARAALDD